MHASDNELTQYVNGNLSAGRTPEFKTHLEQCSRCSTRLQETETFFTQLASLRNRPAGIAVEDRRNDVRRPVNQAASMKELLPGTSTQWREVRILDISRNGLKLQVPEPIDPGRLVQIRLEDLIITAEIRYWVSVGHDFRVGVQIQDVFPTQVGGPSAPSQN